MWIPDTEWSPGWVTWRDSDDYYGWAPMGPGVTISITLSSGYYVPDNYWRFVRRRNFGRNDRHHMFVRTERNRDLIRSSRIMNNARFDERRHVNYYPGPNRQDVEKNIGRRIAPLSVQEGLKPGEIVRNNRLEIYRPDVQKNAVNGQKAAPVKIYNGNDLKRSTPSPTQAPIQPSIRRPSQPAATPQPPKMMPSQPPVRRVPNVHQPSQPPVRSAPNVPQPSQPPVRRAPSAVPQPRRPQPSQPRAVPQPREQPNSNHAPVKRTPTPRVQGKYN